MTLSVQRMPKNHSKMTITHHETSPGRSRIARARRHTSVMAEFTIYWYQHFRRRWSRLCRCQWLVWHGKNTLKNAME